MKRTYLDYASAAPVSSAAHVAFLRASKAFGNPSSPHEEGRAAKEVLEEARRTIARHLGAKPDAILFTSGATEANGLAIRGHVKALTAAGRAPEDIHLLYLPSAHSSTVEIMEALGKEGVSVEALALAEGKLDLARIRTQVRDTTALVSVDVVCGETGTRFDIRGLRQVVGNGVRILADASQAPLVESVERTRLMADFITLDAAKIGGVRGLGVLCAPPMIPLVPVIEGGGQERGVRSGTQTPALAAAFAAALEEAARKRDAFVARAASLRDAALRFMPEALVNGTDQAPHIINISLPGIDTEYLAALLNEDGIAVSTRSACETDSGISRAVMALSGDEDRAKSTLRISFGHSTGAGDIARFGKALTRNLQFLRSKH